MMPPMKPIGRNTATTVSVVASTASPISCVPSSAACRWLLPMLAWRTMFSRTTMASSISRPIDSDSASRVMTLRVKPASLRANRVPIRAIGSVSPVITVLRHEPRNSHTISTVSSAPSNRVARTLARLRRTCSAVLRSTVTRVPAGRAACIKASAALTASAVATTLAPRAAVISMASAGVPLTSARLLRSSAPSRTVATSASRMLRPARLATTSELKSLILPSRLSTRRLMSWPLARTRPAGVSRLSRLSASTTSLAASPSAWRRTGSRSMRTSRRLRPTSLTSPTPPTCIRRFFTCWSARVDSATGVSVDEASARVITGSSLGLARLTVGGSTSRRRRPVTVATRSRTSCTATVGSVARSNSTTTVELPSNEYERMCLTPLMVLTASSIGRVTSLSTTTGEAPG